MSYVSPLFDGLFKGVGENFHIGCSLLFGLPVGGDVETHLHRSDIVQDQKFNIKN